VIYKGIIGKCIIFLFCNIYTRDRRCAFLRNIWRVNHFGRQLQKIVLSIC